MRFAEKTKQCGNSIRNFPKRHPKVWFSLVMAVMMLFGGGVGALLCGHVIPEIQRYLSFNELDTMTIYPVEESVRQKIEETGNHNYCLIKNDDYFYNSSIESPGDDNRRYIAGPNGEKPADDARTYNMTLPVPISWSGYGFNWVDIERRSIAMVEVEYMHFRDIRYADEETNKYSTPTVLAECYVLRLIASRDGELSKAELQPGSTILVMMSGSTSEAYGEAPAFATQEGKRAILMLDDYGSSTYPAYQAYHTASFYIPCILNETGEYLPDCTSLNKQLEANKKFIDDAWAETLVDEEMTEYTPMIKRRLLAKELIYTDPDKYTSCIPGEQECIDFIWSNAASWHIPENSSYSDLGRWVDKWFRNVSLYPRHISIQERKDYFAQKAIVDKKQAELEEEKND